jgi:hypothetical protein
MEQMKHTVNNAVSTKIYHKTVCQYSKEWKQNAIRPL